MSRKSEYLDLIQELNDSPVELEYTLTRAQARIRAEGRRRLLTGFLGSILTFVIAFVVLVNSSLTFAHACGRIPLIKELAQLVAFSPSLSAAVENRYVQPIELERKGNEITARVEYVIVDQKQLEIFYSLDSTIYSAMEVTPEIRAVGGEPFEGYSLGSSSFNTPNRELRQFRVDFLEGKMPDRMELILKIYDRGSSMEKEPMQPAEDVLLGVRYEGEPEYISRMAFLLEFDPYFTAQGETIALDQTFAIDGQTLTAATIDIYPTHIRLNLEDHEENTAWLKSLEFYLEDDHGNRFEAISNGITATGSVDSPMMASHRLESSFFSKSRNLTLYITGATWLDKEMERVHLDLKNKTIEALPQGVELEEVERRDETWLLTFSAKQFKENASHQLWGWSYYDEEGNEYHLNGVSSNTGGEYDVETGKYIESERFSVKFALENYPYDDVYLNPAYSRVVKLAKPVEIKVK